MHLPNRELWFALQVCSKSEHKVASLLERKGYECLLPTYESKRQRSTRMKILQVPLFPGYVFCRMQEGASLMVTTPGVVRILGFGKTPFPISEEEIYCVRRAVSHGNDVASCAYLRVGAKVRVRNGPLAGLAGILVQIKNRHRLVLSIDLIMQSMSVDVDVLDVGPLDQGIEEANEQGQHVAGLSIESQQQ
jgi:transcription antitermination factor NusG